MANNYTLFSVALGQLTNEECEWLKAEYARTHEPECEDINGDFDDNPDYDREAGCFDMDLHDGDVSLYSEDSGDCEAAAMLIQAWLTKFHPKEHVVLEVAFTCSKARPGEFGGSACVITATKQHWMSTDSWAVQKVKELGLK